jgi:phosphotransferase system enzyme I (PtsI)
MIEVPSLAIIADIIAKDVDFFSIGTNDLIQYSMAVDRANKEVAYLYNPLHPAILRMLKYVSDVAKDQGVKLFMCGEMAGDPFNLPLLLSLEMDELSMNPQSIPVAKTVIRSLSAEDTKRLMKKVFKLTQAKDISEMIQKHYGDVISKAVFPE